MQLKVTIFIIKTIFSPLFILIVIQTTTLHKTICDYQCLSFLEVKPNPFLNVAYSTLSWRRSLSYKNQSIDLQSKSVDWVLHDTDLRHERVKHLFLFNQFLSDNSKMATCTLPSAFVFVVLINYIDISQFRFGSHRLAATTFKVFINQLMSHCIHWWYHSWCYFWQLQCMKTIFYYYI